MLADGLTKGGIDRLLLHSCSNGCEYSSKHGCFMHSKAPGSCATKPQQRIEEEGPQDEGSAVLAPGPQCGKPWSLQIINHPTLPIVSQLWFALAIP